MSEHTDDEKGAEVDEKAGSPIIGVQERSDQDKPLQIAFEDEITIERRRRRAHEPGSRRRSASRDSISSAQSRARGISGIPVEFRTLSFQVAESQALSDKKSGRAASREKVNDVAGLDAVDFHSLSVNNILQQLRTSPKQGLSHDAAAKRLAQDGPNTLPRQRNKYFKKILKYVFGGFCSILWVGVIIFFICWRPLGNPPAPYNLGLAILVLIVILLQASFSAFQDWSTAKTMNSILDLVPSDALVLREGNFVKVPSSGLVVGDIVKVSIGDKVPADLRLMETSSDLRFDRSMLTGESEEVEASTDCTDDNFLETRNIALMGTIVTNGSGTGVIVLTGAKSVMGRIATATSNVKERPTLIQREISRFVKIICGLTAVLASIILFTWVGWLRVDHYAFMNVVEMLNDVMGCVVAFIPEGMPVGVALTLMMIARRMKLANVLPKGLSTVEMLGCVNVICSDKTGTLTENKMTITTVGFLDETLTAEEAEAALKDNTASPALVELRRGAVLCNDAFFDPTTLSNPVKERLTQGNPTEGAILRFTESTGPGSLIKNSYPQISQIPFNSKNKWMLTLHENVENKSEKNFFLAVVKGAPDVLLPKCSSYWASSEVKPLDEAAIARFSDLQLKLSRKAERVLLLCQRYYTPGAALDSNDLGQDLIDNCVKDLTILGVLGVFDPPREESKSTVAACRRAGIRFFMMTGDFGLTGAAVARDIGIFTGDRDPDTFATIEHILESENQGERYNNSLLLEGNQINELEDESWDIVCKYEEIVFGRCSPEAKLRIIEELRKRGYATAVTGDGVNDAPALKAADVGIAIVTGSDVALEAADLILLEKFDSIIDGIRLGRLVFQNLQKASKDLVIAYLLPAGSWSEIWPVLINVFFGVPLPLSSFLMIIICVFTDLFCSLSLIMEKEEFDLLSLPPRNHKKDHLINLKIYTQSYLFIGVMETICAHAMYFLYYWRHAGIPISALWFAFEGYSEGFYGYSESQLIAFNTTGQSVYFVTLVLLQWGNILSVRNKRMSIFQADPIRKQRRNPYLLGSVIISLVIAIFVTEEPGIQSIFGTASVPLEFWLIPIPLALGILMMDEIRKLIVRLRPKSFVAKIAW